MPPVPRSETSVYSATADNTGVATATLPGAPQGWSMWVQRITFQATTKSTSVSASVYAGSVAPQNLRDYSPPSTFTANVADEAHTFEVPGGQELVLVFGGLSAGDTVAGNVQWQMKSQEQGS